MELGINGDYKEHLELHFDIKIDVFQYTNYEANKNVLIKMSRLSPISLSFWYCLEAKDIVF